MNPIIERHNRATYEKVISTNLNQQTNLGETESGTFAYSKDFITGTSKLEVKTTIKAFLCVRK